jgi:hypothetical protein
MQPDFLPVADLAIRTGYSKQALYDTHCRGVGPLAEILTKLGGRLGAWRGDYEVWVAKQRKLPDARQDSAA